MKKDYADLEKDYADLKKDYADLKSENVSLRIEVKQLQNELSKYKKPKKDSSNSSIPPSQDSNGPKKNQSTRTRSGKKSCNLLLYPSSP